jgi:glycosyltransferase involved in cell wall biosynthesis
MEELVSVIISSYNRYDLLLNAIESVKKQTYKNIEIIVIDDGSSDEKYRKSIVGVNIVNLGDNNSRNKLGYPSCGYVRNFGFKLSKGKYIAIIDDDDYWLNTKIEKQVNILKETDLLLTCTESFICHQNITSKTPISALQLYNKEYWWEALKKKLNLDQDFSNIIDSSTINKHNCIICSSVLFDRKLFDLIGYMQPVKNWSGSNGVYQDWDYWKKTSYYSNIYYIKEPLMIYYHSRKKDYCA